ncbi:gcc2 and gcc3 domain-containing protein [Cystoisospora suis]|uniref:Gcc2 and gcc3 domain-containing protein n=1 Tax=Cystoisospora suis TaxID=483139 RepID=A0A2C6LBJ8_9APIC|nr:gcc2 and gcc3 domain-containing protein [Cystoisospora suis]
MPDTYCGIGTYCPRGSQAPLDCPANHYCGSTHLAEPTGQCAAGYICVARSSTPRPTLDVSGNACPEKMQGHRCPAGHYCPAGKDVPWKRLYLRRSTPEEGKFCTQQMHALTCLTDALYRVILIPKSSFLLDLSHESGEKLTAFPLCFSLDLFRPPVLGCMCRTCRTGYASHMI